jgi:acetyltransferase
MNLPVQTIPALPSPEDIILADGSHAVIRPIQSEDAKHLKATFLRLSSQSIYFRFMAHKKELTDEEAQHLANVDYRTHMAFVALIEEDGKPVIVGVSRYALFDLSKPDMAESAVVVRDDCQHRGIGRLLLWRLVDYARLQGVRYLRGIILPENLRMVELIKKGGLPFEKRFVDGYFQITIDIGS